MDYLIFAFNQKKYDLLRVERKLICASRAKKNDEKNVLFLVGRSKSFEPPAHMFGASNYFFLCLRLYYYFFGATFFCA